MKTQASASKRSRLRRQREFNERRQRAVGIADLARAPLSRVAAMAWSHSDGARLAFVSSFIATAIGLGSTLLVPVLLAQAVDAAIAGRLGIELVRVAIATVVALLAQAVAEVAGVRVSGAITASAQQEFFEHSMCLGPPGRRRFNDADLLNRFAGDVRSLGSFAATVQSVITTLGLAVGGVIALLFVDWLFAVVVGIGVGVMSLMTRSLLDAATSAYLRYRESLGRLVGRYLDAYRGRRTIRACGTREREVGRVTELIPAVSDAAKAEVRAAVRLAIVFTGAQRLVRLALLLTGALLLDADRITPGALVAAIAYGELAFLSAAGVADTVLLGLAMLGVSTTRLIEVLDTPPAAAVPASPVAVQDPVRGELTFVGVVMDEAGRRVLDGIDLEVSPGQRVAIVGRSGVGKSTIAALAGRLYDPVGGSVLLDGVDVRDIDPARLRQLVAYAFEQPALLGRTIAETIALGVNADETEIRRAADAVAAGEFIERLPHGYATRVEDAPLSGGERQRLGLARVALRSMPLLVLDDAMSSLDVATEARVAASLERLSRGRTTLLIAHRASTAARADEVVWLDDGRIRRRGPHVELWRDPDYRAVFQPVELSG